jgi:hypothetical protein
MGKKIEFPYSKKERIYKLIREIIIFTFLGKRGPKGTKRNSSFTFFPKRVKKSIF